VAPWNIFPHFGILIKKNLATLQGRQVLAMTKVCLPGKQRHFCFAAFLVSE
jgi:hypothetical protein